MRFWEKFVREVIDARFIIAFSIICLFAYAFVRAPEDDTMKGALIAAFAGAWGYFLASTQSQHKLREQMGQALDLANRAQPDVAVEKADKVVVDGENKRTSRHEDE